MKINQIIVSESMGGVTAGAIATVESPLGGTQKRPDVAGLKPVGKIAKAKKKGPYANSLVEGKMKDLDYDMKNMKPAEFQKKYGKKREEMQKAMAPQQQQPQQHKPVQEAKLDEDDIIVVPGTKMKRKTGFVQHGQSRVDHEVEMARSDVLATMKNAKAIYQLLKDRSEEEGIEGWVQEKLIKANDYLNAVKEYYDEKMMQEAGVIAGGGVGEGAEMPPELLAKMNQKHQDFYKKNPHFTQGKPHTLVAKGAMATKVEPSTKPAQVKKKPMTPFGQQKVDEKAVSKAQQRFMGMAHAMQKGKKIPGASKELKDVAKGMSKKAGHEFAATKHKGLPEKVKKKD